MTFNTEARMNGRSSFYGRLLAFGSFQLGNYSIQVVEFTSKHRQRYDELQQLHVMWYGKNVLNNH